MRASICVRPLPLVAVLAGGLFACGAQASEQPVKSGQVRYTAASTHAVGTADAVAVTRPVLGEKAAPLLVASVDPSVITVPSQVVLTPANFDLRSAKLPAPAAGLQGPTAIASGSGGPSQGGEPGFWATSLSTLALGLFFFLRRLA